MKLRLVLLALALAPWSLAESLEAILARMDQNAKSTTSFAATLKRIDYTDIVSLSEPSSGEIRLKRTPQGTIGIVEFKEPDPKIIHFTPGMVEQYLPKAKLWEAYDLRKQSKALDRYLLLSFGLSGADLKKDYTVTLGGVETVGGVATTRLQLIPKNKEAREMAAKIELWIPEGKSHAIQQKVTEPNKDYELWSYEDVKLNPALPDSAFKFTAPAGVTRKDILKN